MVKCPRCGYDNLSSTQYCVNCSYALNDSSIRKNKNEWKMGTAKKIALIIGIIAIALILFSVIYTFTQPSKEESLNVIEADSNVQESSPHPYELKIIYDGSWFSKSGHPSYPQENTGNGTKVIKLNCASWDTVYVYVEKSEDSTQNMKVQLLRNGEVVAENSTTSGQISFAYSN